MTSTIIVKRLNKSGYYNSSLDYDVEKTESIFMQLNTHSYSF